MDVLGELVARDRRTDESQIRFGDGPSNCYSAHKFCTDSWKASNLFRYHGVGQGRTVAIADDLDPAPLVAFFGATLLGATVRFDPPTETDARVLVANASDIDRWILPPGSKRIAYNGPPDDPTVSHFERDIWSENPTMPPDDVDPAEQALATADSSYTHETLVSAAQTVVDEFDLTSDDSITIRASLAEPGTVVAGVLAPLVVCAEIRLPTAGQTGTVTVGDRDGDGSGSESGGSDGTGDGNGNGESRVIEPDSVL